MTAATKIYRDLTYIYFSIGAQGYLKGLSFQFINEHGYFYPLCKAQLADNTIQIFAVHTIKFQILFLKISNDAFSIQKHNTLCKYTSHYLILNIGLLVKGFINDLTEIKTCLHQFTRDTHGFR